MSNYQKITDQILAQMQTVGAGWMNPMQGGRAGMPRNAVTGRRYSGINVMLLGLTGQAWATYKQWQSVGAQVRKGEEGTTVVFFKPLQVKDKETGEDATIPMMRTFTVFNADQVDGYEMEGIELTESELTKILDRHGVRKIDALGATFDPNFHQAVMEEENKDVASGTVLRVLQEGYQIAGRVLRPTMVVVSRGGFKPVKAPNAPAGPAAKSRSSESASPPASCRPSSPSLGRTTRRMPPRVLPLM